jgi:hypothetical protein
MNREETKKILKEKVHEVAEIIRQYTRDQKELWQQIPYLALEAEGVDGYNDRRSVAYETGYLCLSDKSLTIDLLSGDIVDYVTGAPLACDSSVVRCLFDDLPDAQFFIDLYTKEAQGGYLQAYDIGKQIAWREKQRKKFDIKKTYTKRKKGLVFACGYRQ